MITEFKDKYFFLSNFSNYGFYLTGVHSVFFKTNEHWYQSQKTFMKKESDEIIHADTAREAKKLGKKVTLRRDWDNVKDAIMWTGLVQKFLQNKGIQAKLISTQPEILIEGNTWHDNFWGDCSCPDCEFIKGKNKLGFQLMQLRYIIREVVHNERYKFG